MDKRKSETLRVRVTPIEKRVLEQLSERELVSMSATLRGLVREAAKVNGLWPSHNEEREGVGAA